MSQADRQAEGAPRIIGRADHCISRKNISKAALKVLYRLREGGYQAFLVGGAVRDLLLGGHPKDFDVSTDASPDEVHALFRNSRIIGRRFRLVHVRFGREIIEVATFRASTDATEDPDAQKDDEGRLIRDNVYGSIDDDVWRRDFTCNALYYNIEDFSVWDYVGGVADVERQRLELIGEAERRLREDPVRVLRAVRFAAKLGFDMDPSLSAGIAEHKNLLSNVPAARLFDEFLKLFQAGFARASYDRLREHGVFRELFPEAWKGLQAHDGEHFETLIQRALDNTDQRVAEGRPVTPMFLLAVLMWWPIKARAAELYETESASPSQALGRATFEVLGRQQQMISMPKRFTAPLREMIALQPRFQKMRGARALAFLEHRRFRAAYDFMLLRAGIGEIGEDVAQFWTEVQELEGSKRGEAFGVGNRRSEGERPKRRRRRRRKPRNDGDG